MTKRRSIIAIVLLVCLLGVGAVAYLVLKPPHLPARIARHKYPLGDDGANKPTFHATVVDAAGKPVAGAKLWLVGPDEKPKEVGVSGADGKFSMPGPKEIKFSSRFVVAQLDGAGIDFKPFQKVAPTLMEQMKLVKDQVIQGRVINTAAQPVAGIKVSVTDLVVYGDKSLDAFLAQWLKNPNKMQRPVDHLVLSNDALLSATTDADGRFTIAGAGLDRFVELSIRGTGIADSKVWVANRPGFDPGPYNKAAADSRAVMPSGLGVKWLVYGPDLTVVVEAERPIRGVVKDIDTGQPRPGAKVALSRDGDELLLLPLTATTDDKGRYEIRVLARARLT